MSDEVQIARDALESAIEQAERELKGLRMALQTLDDFVPVERTIPLVPRRPHPGRVARVPAPANGNGPRKRSSYDASPQRLRETTLKKAEEWFIAHAPTTMRKAKNGLELPPARVELAVSKLVERGVLALDDHGAIELKAGAAAPSD